MNCTNCKCYDPTVRVKGCVNTENVGNIPMRGPCSYPNTLGFYKKLATTDKYSINQAYVGDMSPMWGGNFTAKMFGLNTQ